MLFFLKKSFLLRLTITSNHRPTMKSLSLLLFHKIIYLLTLSFTPTIPTTTKDDHSQSTNLHQSSRQSKTPSSLADYHCSLQINSTRAHSTTERLSPTCCFCFSTTHQAFLVRITTEFKPRSYSAATKYPDWTDAMNSESKPYKTITHGKVDHYHQIKRPLVAIGFFASNTTLIAP